jgi:hypothetical protein
MTMKHLDSNIFKNHSDYWLIADNIKNLYMSDGSIVSLMDFERVLDELDLYAFRNWDLGELVAGPDIGRYTVSCTFMYPEQLMPDPRGGRRLLPFDCNVRYLRTRIKIPIKIEQPEDFIPGTHKARLIERPIWLVEIEMPKALMNDIRTGSVELEDQNIDLEELDQAYEKDLDQQDFRDQDSEQQETAQDEQQSDTQNTTAPAF